MKDPSIYDLVLEFDKRLYGLAAYVTGQETTVAPGRDKKWEGWHIISFNVRTDFEHLAEKGNVGNQDVWSREPAMPSPEWETQLDDAIYHDDIEDLQVPDDSYVLMRFAVDPKRIDLVYQYLRLNYPEIDQEARAERMMQIADELGFVERDLANVADQNDQSRAQVANSIQDAATAQNLTPAAVILERSQASPRPHR